MLEARVTELKEQLLYMASIVERMIGESIESLVERDEATARLGIDEEEPNVNDLEIKIDEMCINFLALYQPDIPQNAGTMLRACACLGVEAAIIGPAGFPVTDSAFRRAGMDYLDLVTLHRHASFEAFQHWRAVSAAAGTKRRLVLLSTRAAASRAAIRSSSSGGTRVTWTLGADETGGSDLAPQPDAVRTMSRTGFTNGMVLLDANGYLQIKSPLFYVA